MTAGPQDPNAPHRILARGRVIPPPTILTIPAGGPYRSDPYRFDLGATGFIQFAITLLTFDPDGEPTGTIAADVHGWHTALDADDTIPLDAGLGPAFNGWVLDEPADDTVDLPAITHRVLGIGARYLFVDVTIIDPDTFDPYAGANAPSATWRIDFE